MNLDLVLPGADGFDQHHIKTRSVEHEHGAGGGFRQSAEVAAAGHGSDEHAGVGEVIDQPDAIAQHRTAGERAGGIDTDDRNREVLTTEVADERRDEGALPYPR